MSKRPGDPPTVDERKPSEGFEAGTNFNMGQKGEPGEPAVYGYPYSRTGSEGLTPEKVVGGKK